MPITLTCTCGRAQHVAESMAGKAIACAGCGRAMHVPAMGRLVGAPVKANPPPRRTPRVLPAVLISGSAVAILAAGGLLAWAIVKHDRKDAATPIAQEKVAAPDAKTPSEPPAPNRREPDAKNPPTALVEPEMPSGREPEKIVLERKKSADEPPTPLLKSKDPTIVEKKPANLIQPLKLVWKLKADDAFYQEILVTQKPTYKVQGLPVAAFLQYRIVSRFVVKERKDDGSLVVEQKIESAKLFQADELTKPSVEGAVAKMPGTTYKLTLDPKMDVTKFEGGPAQANLMQLGGLGMQMASLIDRDGWKELNQATFFQMNDELKPNARWSKPLEHSWGSLGAWKGQTNYQYLGQEKGLHKIAYGLQLAYKAPKAGAGGLMAVNSANFQQPVAGGTLLFDAERGRVIAAEERFRVKGLINVNLLGQNTLVEIDEDQYFLIRIHDKIDGLK